MPTPLILATANPHKVSELRAILGERGAAAAVAVRGLNEVLDPAGRPVRVAEPEETGTTFEANARIKALAYAAQLAAAGLSGFLCLADDSGIEIDALRAPDGTPRPGVISSHYSTDGAETGLSRQQRDEANNARVLRELEGVPPDQRTARFVCHMAVARVPEASSRPEIILEARGVCEGRIGLPPRIPAGEHGFGYDPLFLVGPDHARTSAELPPAEKNRISHRAAAAEKVAAQLAALANP